MGKKESEPIVFAKLKTALKVTTLALGLLFPTSCTTPLDLAAQQTLERERKEFKQDVAEAFKPLVYTPVIIFPRIGELDKISDIDTWRSGVINVVIDVRNTQTLARFMIVTNQLYNIEDAQQYSKYAYFADDDSTPWGKQPFKRYPANETPLNEMVPSIKFPQGFGNLKVFDIRRVELDRKMYEQVPQGNFRILIASVPISNSGRYSDKILITPIAKFSITPRNL